MTSVTPEMTAKAPGSSRAVRWVLLASLALNALFVGGLVSAVVRHGGPLMMTAAGGTPNGIGAFVGGLPAERRGAVWKSTGDKRRQLAPLRRDVRAARRDVLSALTTEPFDQAAFAAAQTRLIEAEHRQRLGQRDILVDVVGTLTAEERRAFIRSRGPVRGGQPGEEDEATQPKK